MVIHCKTVGDGNNCGDVSYVAGQGDRYILEVWYKYYAVNRGGLDTRIRYLRKS